MYIFPLLGNPHLLVNPSSQVPWGKNFLMQIQGQGTQAKVPGNFLPASVGLTPGGFFCLLSNNNLKIVTLFAEVTGRKGTGQAWKG